MHRFTILISLAMVSALAVACGGTSTTPTTPAPATTTDTFTGTIVQSGASVNPFTVSAAGTVTMSLTSVAPLATMALGVGIGSWDGTTCTVISQNDNAKTGATALTGTANPGNYCVRVYDSGNVPADWTVTYSVQVVHP